MKKVIAKYKVLRKLFPHELDRMCEEYSLCTKESSEEYAKVSRMPRNKAGFVELETGDIIRIATDIREHSDTEMTMEQIMDAIIRRCETDIVKVG